MGFTASNLIVGETTVYKRTQPTFDRSGEGSFQALRQKIEASVVKVSQSKKVEKTNDTPTIQKVRVVDDRLIQYKESAFLSDMLSSSKD